MRLRLTPSFVLVLAVLFLLAGGLRPDPALGEDAAPDTPAGKSSVISEEQFEDDGGNGAGVSETAPEDSGEPSNAAAPTSAGASDGGSGPTGPRYRITGYGSVDASVIGFEARGVPDGRATGYGLTLVGGFRFGEFFCLEGSVNWFPIGDTAWVLPLPLVWLPSEHGLYLNLAGGMRLNLVSHSAHQVVPWVSLWYTGHAVLSDYSVGGSGLTWGLGMDWKTGKGNRMQASLRVHRFEGDLEIDRDYVTVDYGRREIGGIELAISISGK